MSTEPLYAVLLWGLWPLWLAAGVADWACHRRTRIEDTSGSSEWVFHAAQAAQVGVALCIALLAELTTLALALLAVLALWHWHTAYLDTRYTHGRRDIGPFEQTVHAIMELVPIFAVVLLALAHPDSWRGSDWRLVAKTSPVPLANAVAFLAVTFAVQLPPLLEEGVRCRRRRGG